MLLRAFALNLFGSLNLSWRGNCERATASNFWGRRGNGETAARVLEFKFQGVEFARLNLVQNVNLRAFDERV